MAKDHRDRTVSPGAVTYVEKLDLPNLKRECIKRGLPFEEVGNKGVLQLQSWFLKNYDNGVDDLLLDLYDRWVTEFLKNRGSDPILDDPAFRLGRAIEKGADGEYIKKRKVRSRIPKLRAKKPRTEDGLYVGTKKAFTYDCQKKGLSKEDTIKQVLEQFPEAKAKSIGIWFNKAKRQKK